MNLPSLSMDTAVPSAPSGQTSSAGTEVSSEFAALVAALLGVIMPPPVAPPPDPTSGEQPAVGAGTATPEDIMAFGRSLTAPATPSSAEPVITGDAPVQIPAEGVGLDEALTADPELGDELPAGAGRPATAPTQADAGKLDLVGLARSTGRAEEQALAALQRAVSQQHGATGATIADAPDPGVEVPLDEATADGADADAPVLPGTNRLVDVGRSGRPTTDGVGATPVPAGSTPAAPPTARPAGEGGDAFAKLAAADAPVDPPTPTVLPSAPERAAPVSQVSDVDGPEAPAAPVLRQVVSVVAPLRLERDGTYQMALDLHPADLGRVRVEVSIRQGEVTLQLHADRTGTGDLLRAHLDDLRTELESAGLRAGNLGVGLGSGDASAHDDQAAEGGPSTGDPAGATDTAAPGERPGTRTAGRVASDSAVDVRI